MLKHTVFRTLLILLVALTSAHVALGGERTHDIEVADYFTQAWVFEQIAISPDGKQVAYPEGRWQESTGDRKADLWIVDVKTKQSQRLTFDRAGYANPQWSPDNQWIYCTARRKREGEKAPYDGSLQVWRINVDGRDPQPVTREADGIQNFALGDKGSLYYVTEKEVVDGDWKDLKKSHGSLKYGHGVVSTNVVWKLDLQSWRPEKLVEENRVIKDLAVATGEKRLAMITTPDATTVSFEGKSDVDIFDFTTKNVTRLPDKLWRAEAPSKYGWLENLAWSPDGNSLAFNVIFDAYPAEIITAHWGTNEPMLSRVKRPDGVSVHGYGSPLAWRGDNDLCFLGDEKARVRLWCVNNAATGMQGDARELTPGNVAALAFSFTPSGDLGAVLMNDVTHPEDLFLLERNGSSPMRLTQLNPQVDTWKIPQISTIAWEGQNCDMVEGVLELPPDYKPGTPVPLIVQLHGGPTTASRMHFEFWPMEGRVLMAAKGYALLSPNYRGSTGYGDKFLTDLIGKLNNIEVGDIMAGVDHLIKKGIVDKDRIGVMGWSNGGYLTNCLITHSDRFKAASSGGTIVDTAMMWGISDESAYPIALHGGTPLQVFDAYRKASPLWALEKVKTPTIIHVGENDERCPPEHGHMLYRALREALNNPHVELLVYPGEGHSPAKYASRKAKMDWDLKWFDRHVRGIAPTKPYSDSQTASQ